MKPAEVFLSRRNLLTLLYKLDAVKRGEESACTIVKYRNDVPFQFRQTMDSIAVIGVEDGALAQEGLTKICSAFVVLTRSQLTSLVEWLNVIRAIPEYPEVYLGSPELGSDRCHCGRIRVAAVEDEDYYVSRSPGPVLEREEQKLQATK